MASSNPTADEMKRDAQAAAREAGDDLSRGADKIAADMRDTAEDLGDNSAIKRMRERGADLADTARSASREYAEMARDKGEEYADRAKAEAERLRAVGQQKADEVAHYAEERYDEVSAMVRRHPAQALGIAAGVGFLVGLILARR